MAVELRPYNVATILLYPGLVRTESGMQAAQSGWLDISNSESPEFSSRIIAALAVGSNLMRRSGETPIGAETAKEFGIRDVDGRQPIPRTAEMV